MADDLLRGIEAVDDAAILDDLAVSKAQELRLIVADGASRAALDSDQPAQRGDAIAVDQQRRHHDLECVEHRSVLPGEAVEDFGLAQPLPAELQQFNGTCDQPVHIIVEERLDQPRIARMTGAAEALEILTGQNLGHGIRRYRTGINNLLISEGRSAGNPYGGPSSTVPRAPWAGPHSITGSARSWAHCGPIVPPRRPARKPQASGLPAFG